MLNRQVVGDDQQVVSDDQRCSFRLQRVADQRPI